MFTIIIPLVDPTTIKIPSGDNPTVALLVVFAVFGIAVVGFSFYKQYQKEKE
ncbi:hypothetical protein LXD69_02770 [Flavobacterium sediminilitoris]|uniref:Gram-positive cocci surface proteins LPxTG domain-containing protein n=1 Tax=Flavobacterium sediminilitoris TaxID=2024526 RepID=A0ABY4HP29_9FLAO|nr:MULTISPECIES: hypothetical protein [Flavobacterium]UOX34443.1 hypothetical protein LXD69_02770 [Flavobacterium sediminilitoris]